MKRKLIIAALALTVSPLAVAAQSGSADANAPAVQTFSSTVDAGSLKSVKLEVKVGKIKINTSSTDKISIKAMANAGKDMHFIFDWTTGKHANALPPGLHLVTHRDGDTLLVSLESDETGAQNTSTSARAGSDANTDGVHVEFGSNGNTQGWKSDWTVTLPARLALDLKVGVGKASVTGLDGGLNAKVGVGKLRAWLIQGPVDAHVGVGDIDTDIRDQDYGAVDLSAGVGHVEFYVNGQENKTGFEQHFTASSQKLTGQGKASYTLKVGVGHVKLKLGVKQPQSQDSGSNSDN